jgi:uncharacterized membrane protein YhhN
VYKKYFAITLVCLLVLFLRLFATLGIMPFLLGESIQCIFPIVLALLLIFFSRLRGRFHRRILVGLLALSLGSFLLMREGSGSMNMYVFISLAFLPLSFTRAFYLDFSSAPELDKPGARIAIALGLVFSLSVYLWLRPHLGIYRIPGLIYTFLLALMMMMAAFRRQRVNYSSFSVILIGCMLFSAAALTYACGTFVKPLSMLVGDCLYIVSLYLIVLGSVERRLVVQD